MNLDIERTEKNSREKTSQRVSSGQVRSSHRRFFSGASRLGWVWAGLGYGGFLPVR